MFNKHSPKMVILSFSVVLGLALWLPMARPTEVVADTVNIVVAGNQAVFQEEQLAAPLSIYTVNMTVDENDGSCSNGDCSLRDAIILANSSLGPVIIRFNISGCGGVCTIQPASPLPSLTHDGITINGYSQPGTAEATEGTPATLLIEINGASLAFGSGFIINSAGNVIKGLVINRFPLYGIAIYGNSATDNVVSGNYIGTNANGTAKLGNGIGVYFGGSTQNNTVGGTTDGERNIISGNDWDGVRIWADATGNTVLGNYIGLDESGTIDLGNTHDGVRIYDGAENNTVGPDNVISGNDERGVSIYGSGTMSNTVSGNYIGTDADGLGDLGNTLDGIRIYGGAQNNTVGGDTDGERNVISGNGDAGVYIFGSDTMNNTVSGNYIGTDADGTGDLGNTLGGIRIFDGAQNNTVGGDTDGERNVISGNDVDGILISDNNTTDNIVSGNYIGTDESGTAVLGNVDHGVLIFDGAQNNTVGPGNVIAHNGRDGVAVSGGSASGNSITQNSIFANDMGIDLRGGANGDITAPVIFTTTQGSVDIVGTACAGCTVEVFENSDTAGEGEIYIGGAIADGSGDFTVTVSYLTKPYLTATATDETDGTSEFSDVFEATVELAPPTGPVYLPIILKNH